MKNDPTLEQLEIIKKAWFNEQVVCLREKIGDATGSRQCISDYKYYPSHRGTVNDRLLIILNFVLIGSLGKVLSYLKKKDYISEIVQLNRCVRVWPILFRKDMSVS
jgi:hypothetical protein